MYSLPNQALFHHLSQVTCGILTSTASNPGVRSGTPRTANKVRLQRPNSFKQAHGSLLSHTSVSSDNVNDTDLSAYTINCSEDILDTLTSIEKTEENGSAINETYLSSSPNTVCDKTEECNSPREQAFSPPQFLVDFDFSKYIVPGLKLSSIQNEFSRAVNKMPKEEIYGLAQQIVMMNKSSLIQNIQAIFCSVADNKMSRYSEYRHHYVSSGSFEVDKKWFWRTENTLINLRRPLNYVSIRTFKTKRDTEAAKERNPSLFSRLKNKIFPRVDSTASPLSQMNAEKLKSMIADLPVDEANKLKIAFAEGYIAANPSNQSQTNRTFRWLRTLQQVLVIAVFTALLASLMGSFGGGMFRVNVGNGNEVMPEDINVSFHDVKGVDEAKAELQEIVEFLRNPEKFVQLGGKLPKGVLLVGPPGTGKTLLARAVAGEAGVPFFHAAGPEFDEILVGQGARRVRDLFKAAKVKAPCVVFIDEIDSVGAKRTNSVLHPYANQTINQLLSEMDGFRQNEGVIVLGATNRREDLDKALLRPGRFDVEVQVPAPEYIGRKEILDYYLSRVKRGDDVDVDILARGTTGFTGADLENMVNQAALKAAIDGADRVQKKHLDFARDKVIMGPERKSRIPDEDTNKITAYHEGGHALVAHYTKNANALHKVTIIPRGHSLGHTAYIPEKEQYHVTKTQLNALMDTMMGGRAAEELIFGIEKVTSGASSDLKQATAIATNMVKEWGMSEKVGLRTVEDGNRSLVAVNELGPSTNELIDSEIKRILQESYDRAKAILKLHSKELKALAEALIKYETLDAEDVHAILKGQSPTTPTKNKIAIPAAPQPPQPSRPISPKPPSPTSPNEVPC